METYFATPERVEGDELKKELELVSDNPVINGLMNVTSGLFAVLNEHRQVLSVNKSFLEATGIRSVDDIIGLRPGETLNCIHAHETESGCGTSEFCPTCGAAIAIVLSLKKGVPVEKYCAIEASRNDRMEDLFFRVKSFPIDFNDLRLILLFLQDITHQQKLIMLEKIFFHDISNMVSGLVSSSNLLESGKEERREKAAQRLKTLTSRLAQEVNLQRMLLQSDIKNCQPSFYPTSLFQLYEELKALFNDHPAARGINLQFQAPSSEIVLNTDPSLLMRVLCNMIVNALEASEAGETVRVSAEKDEERVVIKVWNSKVIAEEVCKRIFQRNFSTKDGLGRGLGTYSMKLLGEQFLGGKISFTSSNPFGTEFRISLKSR